MDPTQQITNLYQTALGRAPDEQGLQFWSGALNQGYTPEQIQAQLQASEEGQKYMTGIVTPNNTGTVQPNTAGGGTAQNAWQPPANPGDYVYGPTASGATGAAWRDNPAMTQLLGKQWNSLYDTWQEIQQLQNTDPFAAESKQQYLNNLLAKDPVLKARFEQYVASPMEFYRTYGIVDGQFVDPSVMEGMASLMPGQRGVGSLLRSMQTKWGAARAGRTPVEDLLAQYNQSAAYTGNTGVSDWLNEMFNAPQAQGEGANWMQPLSEQEAAQIRADIHAANQAQGGNLREVFDGEFIRTEPFVPAGTGDEATDEQSGEEPPAEGAETALTDEEVNALVEQALAGQGSGRDITQIADTNETAQYLKDVYGTSKLPIDQFAPVYGQGEGFYGPDAPLLYYANKNDMLGNRQATPLEGGGYSVQLTPQFDPSVEGGTYGQYFGIYDKDGNLTDVQFQKGERSGGWFNDNLDWLGPLIVGGAAAWGGGLFSGATAGANAGTAATQGTSAFDLASLYDKALTGVGSNVGGIGELLQTGTQWLNQNVFGWLPVQVQPIATNTLINTVLNGGDVKSALTNSLFSAGTNFLGKEIATALADVKGLEAIGGANAVGKIAANAITTAVAGGDFSKISSSVLSGIVGNAVAEQTGNKMIGQVVAQAVNGIMRGADPTSILTGIGAQQLAQQLTGRVLPPGQAQQFATAYMTGLLKQAGTQMLSGK